MSVEIPCVCPPKQDGQPRHTTDTIELRDRLDFRSALTARNAIALAKEEDDDVSSAEILAVLTETYLLLGIQSWSLVDEKGKKVEPSRTAIREFIEAILDYHYPDGRHRDDIATARWRLQFIAEKDVGTMIRQRHAMDDNKVVRLKRGTG